MSYAYTGHDAGLAGNIPRPSLSDEADGPRGAGRVGLAGNIPRPSLSVRRALLAVTRERVAWRGIFPALR